MSMYSKTNVLKKSSFNVITHMLNIVLIMGTSTSNFERLMEIIFKFELQRKNCHQKMVHLGNDDKRLSIVG